MTQQIACDAPDCDRTLTAIADVYLLADRSGWVAGDLTMCPTHAEQGALRVLAAIDAWRREQAGAR